MGRSRDLANLGDYSASSFQIDTITDTSGGNTTSINSTTPTVNTNVGKNKIINGDFTIAQRSTGTTTAVGYQTVDRWYLENNTTDATWGRGVAANLGKTDTSYCLSITTNSTKTISGSTYCGFYQKLEGYQLTRQLGYGFSDAKPLTISFWVRSSKTGTYSVNIKNSSANRCFVKEYTINSADTWEYKTLTIPGCTDGTWNYTNSTGMIISWWLCGSNGETSSVDTWVSSNTNMSTNQVNLFDATGATFYITNVQVEAGSEATEFEHRPYGTELALCQRYYFRMVDGNSQAIATGGYYTATDIRMVVNFPVAMRTAPSVVSSSGTDYFRIQRNGGDDTFNSILDGGPKTPTTIMVYQSSNISGTAGHAGFVYSNNASASLAFNSEL